jgi:single-stranded DNA-binding protein
MDNFHVPPFFKELLNHSDKNGAVMIIPWVFLSTGKETARVKQYLPDSHPSKNTDFSSSPYWITCRTQDGAENNGPPETYYPVNSADDLYSFFFSKEPYNLLPPHITADTQPLPLSAPDSITGKAREKLHDMMNTGETGGFSVGGLIIIENNLHSLEKIGKSNTYMQAEMAQWFKKSGFAVTVKNSSRRHGGKFYVKIQNPECKIDNYYKILENYFSDALRLLRDTKAEYRDNPLKAAKSVISTLPFNYKMDINRILTRKGCKDPSATAKTLISMETASRSRAEKAKPLRIPRPVGSKPPPNPSDTPEGNNVNSNLNSVLISGLIRDRPVFSATGDNMNNTHICTFSVVSKQTRNSMKDAGENVTESLFNVRSSGKLAEFVRDHMSKDQPVRIIGSLRQQKYTAPGGNAPSGVFLLAEHIEKQETPAQHDLNSIIFEGRLAKDPEFTKDADGARTCTLHIASASSENQDADFFTAKVQAEGARLFYNNNIKKGAAIRLVGRLDSRFHDIVILPKHIEVKQEKNFVNLNLSRDTAAGNTKLSSGKRNRSFNISD